MRCREEGGGREGGRGGTLRTKTRDLPEISFSLLSPSSLADLRIFTDRDPINGIIIGDRLLLSSRVTSEGAELSHPPPPP